MVMSDLIGNMDKVVTFYVNTPTDAGAGGNNDGYSAALTTRGFLKKQSGDRNSQLYDLAISNTWYLTVRKQNALSAILSPSLKVGVQGKEGLFTVQSWEDVQEDHFYYKLTLSQQNNA